MNGDSPHGGQPWSVDLLADLHADGGDRTRLDADALEVLAALDATRAELAALPPMRMPDDVAARIDAALAAEAVRARPMAPVTPIVPRQQPAPGTGPLTAQQPPAPVADLAEARRRRNRRLGIAGGLLTAAAIAVGVVFVALPSNTTSGTPQAVPGRTTGQTSAQTDPQNSGPLALSKSDLPAAGFKAYGNADYGPYGDAGKLKACLTANGLGGKPIAGRRVVVDGQQGVMMLLPTGKVNRIQLLVVGDNCAAGSPDTIANTTIGG